MQNKRFSLEWIIRPISLYKESKGTIPALLIAEALKINSRRRRNKMEVAGMK